jgi:hypothetical protein
VGIRGATPVLPGLVRLQQKKLSAVIENSALWQDIPYTGAVHDLVPLAIFVAIHKDGTSRRFFKIDVKIKV